MMEQKNMCKQTKKPEIIVFAGPNGSGNTFIGKMKIGTKIRFKT